MIRSFMNGGGGYSADGVINATNDHLFLVLAACLVSFVGAYMQYFGAITMGFKHRTYSIPLVGNLWFFAHDTTYVVNAHHWFSEVDFWLVKAFWVALLVFACCEAVVTYQLLKYSHNEVFPGMSRTQAILSYACLQVLAYGLFWFFLSLISDPLYLLSFCTTVILAPMFNIALMRSRGSQRGFSATMLWGFVLLAVGFWAWMLLIDPYFRQPFIWIVMVGNIAVAAAGLFVFRSLPPYTSQISDTAERSGTPVPAAR